MSSVFFALLFMMVGAFFGIIVIGLVSASSDREKSDREEAKFMHEWREKKAKQDKKEVVRHD